MKILEIIIDVIGARAASKASLGKAIAYATDHWEALLVDFDLGDMRIGKFEIEGRSIPGRSLARKFSFGGSDHAATRTAVMKTVLHTAATYGLGP